MATVEQLFSVQARQNEIWRRLKAGSLNVDDVLAATQGILDCVYPTPLAHPLPDWYVSPELRLEQARQYNEQRKWGFSDTDFPSVPSDTGKLWLLVVNLPGKGGKAALQRTVDDRWELIEAPAGYTKYRYPELLTDPDHLRLAPGYDFTPGIYWVEFNPDAYQGKSPEAALQQSQVSGELLAGTEVLDAIWQFPGWVLTWFKDGKAAPNLSGLQFRWDDGSAWLYVLCVSLWDDDHRLELNALRADDAYDGWASPVVVREC